MAELKVLTVVSMHAPNIPTLEDNALEAAAKRGEVVGITGITTQHEGTIDLGEGYEIGLRENNLVAVTFTIEVIPNEKEQELLNG